jgi:carboxyl-terminal processing protease
MKASAWTTRLASLLFGLALAGCGGSSNSGNSGGGLLPVFEPCSIAAQNRSLHQVMQEYYLWYREMPTVDPVRFASPEILLEALRFLPVDRFSYLTTVAEEEALFGASQFVGLGFRTAIIAGRLFASDVFEGGPADAGGLMRGSELLAINTIPVAELLETPDGLSDALGPAEVGYELVIRFQNPGDEAIAATFVKNVVTIPPVTAVRIFEVNGKPAGHLVLRNFVQPGIAALDAAFAELRAAGVTQLVIDLRYNGGGLVRVMEHLANLLGSRIAPGAVFASYRHNDKQAARDESFLFRATPLAAALDLERVVFITAPGTASASEMLINGMAPVVSTATVGRQTFGKPVGQLGFQFCERVLRPVSFRVVNGLGQGDYFDGIPADCPAGDTLAVPFGTEGEASFDAAVFWLQQGFWAPAEAFALRQDVEPSAVEPPAAQPRRWTPNDAH